MSQLNQNKSKNAPEHFVRQDRLRLSLELFKCKQELNLALQAKDRLKVTYKSLVYTLIILNFITYGALLYVKYNPAPYM